MFYKIGSKIYQKEMYNICLRNKGGTMKGVKLLSHTNLLFNSSR